MRRRRFLEFLAGSAALGVLGPPPSPVAGSDDRRVRPGEAGWPGEEAWRALSDRVQGRLLRVDSPLEKASSELVKQMHNPYFIGDQVWGTQSTGWAGAWISRPSAYAVTAKTAADVSAAVDFARSHRLRLVVKGGGHSYHGTSNAPDSLLIWTRAMEDVTLHDAFVPRGCEGTLHSVPAVSVGAGALWFHAYDAVTTRGGRYVQGGGCATVGVAGLVQGGGFGSFSKRFGMAAASLLEAEVVTADGVVRVANACTHPDLFWALKGGGGPSFGVVTRLTLRTHTLPTSFGAVLLTLHADSDGAFKRLIRRFVAFYAASLMNPRWGEQVRLHPRNRMAVQMLFDGLDTAQAEEVWRPFLAEVAKPGSGISIGTDRTIVTVPARDFWNPEFLRTKLGPHVRLDDRPSAPPFKNLWWASNEEELGAYWHGYESSWLPASLLSAGRQEALAAALFAASRHWTVGLHFNKGLAGAPSEAIAAARETSTNPAVLDAFALAIIAGSGPPVYPGVAGHQPDPVEARNDSQSIHRAMAELRKVVPEPGSYVLETSYFEPNWQRAFWGRNYPRLRAVKKKYDPGGLFIVHRGVGSEDWSADGMSRVGNR
jgi:FAD/FMN-containing dehydrogenase